MEPSAEMIEKRRRIQIGIYLVHLGLLSGGLLYFALLRELIYVIGTGAFVFLAVTDLLDRTSTIRAPVDKLGIPTIDWNLRRLDWLMIGVLVGLTITEGIALFVYEPSQWQPLSVWLPFLSTAALAPLIVFGWMFDRSGRGVLTTFIWSGFRFPPPEDQFWDDVRANHQEIISLSPVYVAFLVSIGLQFLMFGIWSRSLATLMLWGILVTSELKRVPVVRKAEPVPSFPLR